MAKPPRNRIDPSVRRERARSALDNCIAILETGGIDPVPDRVDLNFRAMITLLLINLADLCDLAWDAGAIIGTCAPAGGPGVADFHDLVHMCRNAACHIGSRNKASSVGGARDFVLIIGRTNVFHDDVDGEFDDDAAVVFGQYRLYLGRHASAAVMSASQDFDLVWPPAQG
jgi:hypothetical protein